MTIGVSRRTLLALSLGLGPLFATEARAVEPRRVMLAPLGAGLSRSDLDALSSALRNFYAVDVQQLPMQPLPRSAYYAPRSRYRAERLLHHLEGSVPEGAFRVMGVTAVDISTTKGPHADWGILGLANMDGSVCVLSSLRCRRSAKSSTHARVRFEKTAVHELGHTFGLEHCPSDGCLMRDGNGTVLTTDSEHELCGACTRRLSERGLARLPPGKPVW
jgi:archaemetzincin